MPLSSIGIVRGADHHAGREAQRAREVGDAGRRHRARTGARRRRRRRSPLRAPTRACSRRCACPCRSAPPGVAACAVAGEHLAGGIAEAQHEVRRDRASRRPCRARRRCRNICASCLSAHCASSTAIDVARFLHVVHAQDRRAALQREQRHRQAAGEAARRRPAGDAARPASTADRRLARQAARHRQPAARQQLAQARSSARLCSTRLAEAEARVEHDALARDAGRLAALRRARAGSRSPRATTSS